jgi:predicted transcriptional regulator
VTTPTLPVAARDLPASARLVYLALAASDARLTTEELAERTAASEVSVKRALSALREAGVVERATHPVDGRRRVYDAVDAPEVAANR